MPLTVESHLFSATAGSNTAREYMTRAVRSRDFPDELRGRAAAILRRIVDVDAELEAHVASIRRGRVASGSGSDSGYLEMVAWATLGMGNAVRELQGAVRKGGREYDRIRRVAEGVLSDMDSLSGDLREYAEGYHPFDWATRTFGDLSERIPRTLAQWTYAPGPDSRPSVVASDHRMRHRPYGSD